MNRAANLTALLFAALLAPFALMGCASSAPETVGAPGRPILLVAWSPNATVRVGFEDRLQGDLAARGIEAVASHDLLQDFSQIQPGWVLRAANQRQAPMILMVRRLITDGEADPTQPPPGAERHPTLQEYFLAHGDGRLPDIPPASRQVIEVAAYGVYGATTELVWSGHSWVDFDGNLERAMSSVSGIIATNLAPACRGISCSP